MLTEIANEERPEMARSLMQAASLVGVSYPTMLRWKDNGEVRCVKQGGRWIVPMAEILRLQGRSVATASQDEGNYENGAVLNRVETNHVLAKVSDSTTALRKTIETFMVRQQELATMMVHNTRVIAKRMDAMEQSMTAVLAHAGDLAEGRAVMAALARELRIAKDTIAAATNLVAPEQPHQAGIKLSTRSLVEVEAPPPDDDDETILTVSATRGADLNDDDESETDLGAAG
jgi:hypothetical protein